MKRLLKNISLQDLKKGKLAAGLEIVVLEAGFSFNLVVLRKNKEALEVIAKHSGLDSVEEVKSHLPQTLPLNIMIRGKGVIHKMVQNQYIIDETRLVQAVMPNANQDEFYVDHTTAGQNQTLVSLIRKEHFNAILDPFISSGHFIVSACLGPFSMADLLINLIGMSESNAQLIQTGGYEIACNAGVIESIGKRTDAVSQYRIGNEGLDSNSVSAFGLALKFHISDLEELPTLTSAILHQRGEFVNKRLFQYTGIGMLAFFLTVLLVNVLSFTHYKNQYRELDTVSAAAIASLNQLRAMKAELELKEHLLASTGLSEAPRTSLHADRIAQTVPSTIELSLLSIGPLEKRITEDHKPLFNQEQIVIAGKCQRTTDLNSWVKTLAGLPWVRDVSVTDFSGLGKGTSGEFELVLKL